MKLFNELPTILPFYTDIRNQNRQKENVKKNCPIPLFSPVNSFLPFTIKLPSGSTRPTAWKIFDQNDIERLDISNNVGLLTAFDFGDSVYCFYHGDPIQFVHGSVNQQLNLTGSFYLKLTIDGIDWISEVFTMCDQITDKSFSDRFVKIVFWDDRDIDPIKYRDGFKQIVYFDTFIHTSDPEIEQEKEPDGYGNENPTFEKLIVKQKMEVIVPDFLKIAMLTLQMHNNVEVYEKNKRSGKVDRTTIVSSNEDFGSFATLDVTFETDILIKSACGENQPIISQIWD